MKNLILIFYHEDHEGFNPLVSFMVSPLFLIFMSFAPFMVKQFSQSSCSGESRSSCVVWLKSKNIKK